MANAGVRADSTIAGPAKHIGIHVGYVATPEDIRPNRRIAHIRVDAGKRSAANADARTKV